MEKARSFPVPHDVTQFSGLAPYYRRFVPKFANIASPLHALLKINNALQWSTECWSAFNHLRKYFLPSLKISYVWPLMSIHFGDGC